ncbi:MAG: HIT domain-containing protein [Promethearchaeota archaeon]
MSKLNDKVSKIIIDEISEKEIPFMHYGIINRYNNAGIDLIPIKRWDPLSYNPIILFQNGNLININKNYGHYSYISPIRATRPRERKTSSIKNLTDQHEKVNIQNNLEEIIDIFEPMVQGKHFIDKETGKIYPAHSIIISDGNLRKDNPFSTKIRVYKDLKNKAFSMINKFPAMVRVIDPSIKDQIQIELSSKDKYAKVAKGICFLTIPKFYHETIEDMTIEEIEDFFIATQTAISYSIEEAKKQENVSIIPISPFFNVGREVGGSLRRLHMQVYMDLNEDGHGSRMESILRAFEYWKKQGVCHLCHSKHGAGERVVLETEEWTFFTTNSPIRNYHIRFTPKSHIEHFGKLTKRQIRNLASILQVISEVLNDLNVNPNRNIIINTRPYGYDSEFHLFGDILPFELVGGAEMSDDMRVVRVSPTNFAEKCRKIIKKKKYDKIIE